MKIDRLAEKITVVARMQRAEMFMVCSELRDGVRRWRELDGEIDQLD